MTDDTEKTGNLAELFDTEQTAETEILEQLMSLENLDRKTDLTRPIIWSILESVARFLDTKKLAKSAGILDNFTQISFRYLISKNRRGRGEYVQAVEAFADEMKAKAKSTEMPR